MSQVSLEELQKFVAHISPGYVGKYRLPTECSWTIRYTGWHDDNTEITLICNSARVRHIIASYMLSDPRAVFDQLGYAIESLAAQLQAYLILLGNAVSLAYQDPKTYKTVTVHEVIERVRANQA